MKVENKIIPTILIVDDIPANLYILSEILESMGCMVLPVTTGMMALQVATNEKPDLILLDIKMPEMDGFDVCRKLKENEKLKDIPVIFVSAFNDTENIVKSLTAGGVDYITKPYKIQEIKARVTTHLKLYRQTQELQKLNNNKDRFITILAHDLKNPMNATLNITEILKENIRKYDIDKIENIVDRINQSTQLTYNLVLNLLSWTSAQSGKIPFNPQTFLIATICNDVIKILKQNAENKNITITNCVAEELAAFADIDMINTIFRNLISNAIKYTHHGGHIEISAEKTASETTISVTDNGIGIASKIIPNLFDVSQTYSSKGTANENGTGLGLLLCQEFINKHNGKIRVESTEGKGSVFYFSIPNE